MADQLIYDYRLAPLSREDRALCDIAAKLTLKPGEMSKGDFERLIEHGFMEEQISIAVQVIGYFNYINRVAEGLGVDPEDWMKPPPAEWRRRKAKDYDLDLTKF
ncbi:MAG: peroxidase [Verrucomicrobia bacterium]|nr:peroxidase [Verrucomicrobiota bacterium]